MRCVVDTNVFVSAAMFPDSIPSQAVRRVLNREVMLVSEPTLDELMEVLFRPKFDFYVNRKERALFVAQLGSVAEVIPIIQLVRECRDPKDDKFLEVALNGRADLIVTGDANLLLMHPWRNVEILSPLDYLKR